MLLIERDVDEWVVIRDRGEEFRIGINRTHKGKVWLVFDAPKSVEIIREELAATWRRKPLDDGDKGMA